MQTSVIYEQFQTMRVLVVIEDGPDVLIHTLPLHNIALPYPHPEHGQIQDAHR